MKPKIKLAKVAYKQEPKLKIHNYVVTISKLKGKSFHTAFKYAKSLKEVKSYSEAASKGSIIEVFKATHNFIQAYEKV